MWWSIDPDCLYLEILLLTSYSILLFKILVVQPCHLKVKFALLSWLKLFTFIYALLFCLHVWPKAGKKVVASSTVTDCVKLADDIVSYLSQALVLNQIKIWQTLWYHILVQRINLKPFSFSAPQLTEKHKFSDWLF